MMAAAGRVPSGPWERAQGSEHVKIFVSCNSWKWKSQKEPPTRARPQKKFFGFRAGSLHSTYPLLRTNAKTAFCDVGTDVHIYVHVHVTCACKVLSD